MKNFRFGIFIICLASFLCLESCSVHRISAYYDFRSKLIGSELDGSYTIKAYGRARHALDAYEQAQKQAVYDIVFNGVSGETANFTSLKPILLEVNAKEKYASYFENFFKDNGEYKNYVSMKEKRFNTSRWFKSDKQSVCETSVCVFRSKLIDKLKQDNILK